MAKKAAFVYDDALSKHVLRDDHPLKATRLRYTYELLDAYGAFSREGSGLVKPRPATDAEILTVHASEYLEAVKGFSSGAGMENQPLFNFGAGGDNPTYPGIYEAASLSTGASLVAAHMVADGEVDAAFNVSGGLHHAAPTHASGFCVFNDPAVAIQYLLSRGMRVLYVDIDAHHGDGVQNIFYGSDQVLTISIHESGRFLFPGTGHVEEVGVGEGRGYSVNIPLFPYTGDEIYLWAFRKVVPPLVEAFRPDVLVGQLGIDSYQTDPLTHLMLTSQGYTQAVTELANLGLPFVAMGGGGYDQGAVARCWSLAYGIMLGTEWPDRIPQTYTERYGMEALRDTATPEVEEPLRQQMWRFAEETVQDVEQQIFPIHRLA